VKGGGSDWTILEVVEVVPMGGPRGVPATTLLWAAKPPMAVALSTRLELLLSPFAFAFAFAMRGLAELA